MTTITALPPAPSRTDPATFSDKSDALLGALETFVTETNTVAGEVNANAIAAAASASTATTQAGLATTNGAAQVVLAAAQVTLATAQANNAAASATAAAQASNAAMWVSGATYALGDVAISPIDFVAYRRIVQGAGTTDPSADNTNWTRAVEGGISYSVTATAATTLTSTPTLLQITPANYGVTVTLPDATTCSTGGPLYIIDNKSVYTLRVANSAGTLLGFVEGGKVSHISLIDKSAASGVWSLENIEPAGISAQLYAATNITSSITSCIDLGGGREILIGSIPSSSHCYAVVYNKTTNSFGSVTLVRATGVAHQLAACLVSTDKVLLVSCTNSSTAFEAVVLSISGTTIAVGTAATATLSANINRFGNFTLKNGLIACNGSFVCSYSVATPACEIRAISVSGTTPTIGNATALDGTASGTIAATASGIIAASTATTHLYTKYYGISGTTITPGTGTDTNSGTMTINKVAALGARWVVLYNDGGATVKGGIVSLSGTATSISIATLFSAGTLSDASIVGSTKVLALNNQTTSNANILTDTSGTASAGTAITLDDQAGKVVAYVSGTTAMVISTGATSYTNTVDCSGSSPVLTTKNNTSQSSSYLPNILASDAVFEYGSNKLSGTAFMQSTVGRTSLSTLFSWRIKDGASMSVAPICPFYVDSQTGKSNAERWAIVYNGNFTTILKMECAA